MRMGQGVRTGLGHGGITCVLQTQFCSFYAPVTIVGGIKICPCLSVCLSVCPSVRHALQYGVCVINSSHSFYWIFLKPNIFVLDILKMCMWVFGGARINFDRITAFRT